MACLLGLKSLHQPVLYSHEEDLIEHDVIKFSQNLDVLSNTFLLLSAACVTVILFQREGLNSYHFLHECVHMADILDPMTWWCVKKHPLLISLYYVRLHKALDTHLEISLKVSFAISSNIVTARVMG